MEYEIVKLSLLSGMQCTVYSIVHGGGGLKTEDTRAWQDDPKLTEEATRMIEYAKDIAKRMDDGEIYMSRDNPELEGNFYFFEDEE